jgi:FG-GAP repeat
MTSFQLSRLNGANGFRLDGVNAGDQSGYSVASAGDVNGDGFDDIIIGAPFSASNGLTRSGESYVVFGAIGGFEAAFSLDELDGSNGFRVNGATAGRASGYAVSAAGDVNGDGLGDVIIGSWENSRQYGDGSGESYVIFGSTTRFSAALSLSDLDGSNGFRLNGVNPSDYAGFSVASAGDVNGDGFDDILVGRPYSGGSYVVFGTDDGFAASLSLGDLNGSNGFRIEGAGSALASAGDINGDGFDDILIGASSANPGGTSRGGESYVVFGTDAGYDASISLDDLNGANGFRLVGATSLERSGTSVASAGDVNGDGLDDILIGAPGMGGPYEIGPGGSYLFFGSAERPPATIRLSDLDGSNGFLMSGVGRGDENGRSVSSAGDVNGDGFDDILIGAPRADPNHRTEAGESYVVLGAATGFASAMGTGSLNGSNGFRIPGIYWGDRSGYSVSSAGDVNGDGFGDILIGAFDADPNQQSSAGESYLIFGGPQGFAVAATIEGTAVDDWLSLPTEWRFGLRKIDGSDGTDMMSFAELDGGIYANTQTGQANSGFASTPFDLIMTSIENVTGTSHADTFNGSDQAEVFRGLGGQDTFYGSHAGADTYEGGGSSDTLTYIQSGEGVSASLFRGRGWSGDAQGDLISEIENLTGTNHDDFLWGDHGDNTLTGGHGDDQIVGAGGDDYILAGHGTDTIVYSGNRSDYTILQNGIRTEVIDTLGRDGHDVIGHAEVLQFADGDFIL